MRRERYESEVVTGRQVRDGRRLEVRRSIKDDDQVIFKFFA
jgi:hypothetical protein